MANREALRDLQSRLAQRLQAARAEGVQASWLAVEAGGRNFLLPLAHSGEIFPYVRAHPVPYTRPWFLGVANLRGGLYGVVDFAGFLVNGAPAVRSEAARAESRLIALNAALEVNCAILIDRLSGLRSLESFVSSSGAPAESPHYFGSCYFDVGGTAWQEINLQTLSQQSQFLSIRA